MVYSYNEAFSASLKYFNGDELATAVFLDKYALKNNDQELLEKTPEDMHWRIASEISRIEQKKFAKPFTKQMVFSYLHRFKKIIPQGSPMYGIGNPYQLVSLSNCYVLSTPLDSYSGIHKTDEQISQISKRRGGVGIDISKLRPAGATTKNAARTSTGIIPFMERFSNSIREVGQSGRRGACLMSISVHHPQVSEFAKIKRDLSKVTGANISVRLTDEFLNAVQENKDYEQRWPVDSKEPKVSQMVSARKVWMDIIENAHYMAEPGLLFWDTILRESPADCYDAYKTESTNPCSELPLSPLDSCRLLLVNLYSYVKNPFKPDASFDYDEFYKDAQVAQRFMDDIVDLEIESIDRIVAKIESDPEPAEVKANELQMWKDIRITCLNGRRTGTGITGLGDALAAINVRYGSNQSIEVTERIYRTLKLGCYRSSVDMAKELGAFPVWDFEKEKNNPFLNRIKGEDSALYDDMKKHGRRNIALLTTAPAGSVSILTQTTSGIEPVFMTSYKRRKKVNPNDANNRVDFVDQNGDSWQEFIVYHTRVLDWMQATDEQDIAKSPYHGCCAEDLDWRQRVILQCAANLHVDHSISSTLNLPEDVSVERVAEIYETAWKHGAKGITVYRKNCRTGVLVEAETKRGTKVQKHTAPVRPREMDCEIHVTKARGKEYFVIVGLLGKDLYEVFAGENVMKVCNDCRGKLIKEKRGIYRLEADEISVPSIAEFISDEEEALTRMISMSLRHGADINFVVHQLEKVKGDMLGFAKSISRVLKKYIVDGTKVSGEVCQSCSAASLIRQEGCVTCASCGWSRCS